MYFHDNFYKFSIFKPNKNIIHGVSTRFYGSIRNKKSIHTKNLSKFIEHLSKKRVKPIFMNQVHSGNVKVIKSSKTYSISQTDGIITNNKNTLLCAVTADCVSVIFFDPRKNIIGVAHAGFKGILNKIINNMVTQFESRFNSLPSELKVAIGPSIGSCCYDVDKSRIDLFKHRFPNYNNIYHYSKSKIFLNLKKIVFLNLLEYGVLRNNIETSRFCTNCNRDKLFSYRGDSSKTYGEFATVVGLI